MIMSFGYEPYSCREAWHPGLTCKQLMYDKLWGSGIHGLKLCFIATFLPIIFRKRKDLMSGDLKKMYLALKRAVMSLLRASAFIMLTNSIPLIIQCNLPHNSPLIRYWSLSTKYVLIYLGWAMASLILEEPQRLPAYMGFTLSKSIGIVWGMLKMKSYGNLKDLTIFDTLVKWVLLAGLVGLVSAK